MSYIVVDPTERLHDLEMANAVLRDALRLALPYVAMHHPLSINEPLCDSDGCLACREVRVWQKALDAARQALGEEML